MLPIYEFKIDEADEAAGLTFVSLVDDPAIEKTFQIFANREPMKFSITDEEKRIVSGPAMIANLPIYRLDPVRGEYYGYFSAQTIWQLARKFFRENRHNAVNMQHSTPVESGVHLIESWFVQHSRGVMPPKGYEDVTDGSWFISYLIDNEEVWNKCKAGSFNGFSIEGYFDTVHVPKAQETEESRKLKQLKKLLDKVAAQGII